MIRRRPTRPLQRRQPKPPRTPVACKEVLSGAPAAGKLTGPLGDTKMCEDCYVYMERNGAHLLGDGIEMTREI